MQKKHLLFNYLFLFLLYTHISQIKSASRDSFLWPIFEIQLTDIDKNAHFHEKMHFYQTKAYLDNVVDKLIQRIEKSSLKAIYNKLMEKHFFNILEEQNKLNKFIVTELLLKKFNTEGKFYTNLNELDLNKIEEIKKNVSLLDKNLHDLDNAELESIKKELLMPYIVYFYHLNKEIQKKFTIYKNNKVFPNVNLFTNVDEKLIQNKFQKNIRTLIKNKPNIKLRCAIIQSIFETAEFFHCQ